MKINQVKIDDTYAEAFAMRFTRLIVTADDEHWLQAAAASFGGYGTSVIACDAETGIERHFSSSQTPDGRAGIGLLAFAFSTKQLEQAVINRMNNTCLNGFQKCSR